MKTFSHDLALLVGLIEWVVALDGVRVWKGLFPVQREHSRVAEADAEKPMLCDRGGGGVTVTQGTRVLLDQSLVFFF